MPFSIEDKHTIKVLKRTEAVLSNKNIENVPNKILDIEWS